MNPTDQLVLPIGWCDSKLSEILPLSYGKGLVEKSRESNGSVPVYGSSGIVGSHTSAFTSGPTLVIGRKGSVGEIHYSPGPCWPIDTTYFVEATESLNLYFFAYELQALELGSVLNLRCWVSRIC